MCFDTEPHGGFILLLIDIVAMSRAVLQQENQQDLTQTFPEISIDCNAGDNCLQAGQGEVQTH